MFTAAVVVGRVQALRASGLKWGRRVNLPTIELQPGVQVTGKQGFPVATGNVKDSFSTAFGESLRDSEQVTRVPATTEHKAEGAYISAETSGTVAQGEATAGEVVSGRGAKQQETKPSGNFDEARSAAVAETVGKAVAGPILRSQAATVALGKESVSSVADAAKRSAAGEGEPIPTDGSESSVRGSVNAVVYGQAKARVANAPVNGVSIVSAAMHRVVTGLVGEVRTKLETGSSGEQKSPAAEVAPMILPRNTAASKPAQLGATPPTLAGGVGKSSTLNPLVVLPSSERGSATLSADAQASQVARAVGSARTSGKDATPAAIEETALSSAAIASGTSKKDVQTKSPILGNGSTAKTVFAAVKANAGLKIQAMRSQTSVLIGAPGAALAGQDVAVGAAQTVAIAQQLKAKDFAKPGTPESTLKAAIYPPNSLAPTKPEQSVRRAGAEGRFPPPVPAAEVERRAEDTEMESVESRSSARSSPGAKVESAGISIVAGTSIAPVHMNATPIAADMVRVSVGTHVLPTDTSTNLVSGISSRPVGSSAQAASRVPVRIAGDAGVQRGIVVVAQKEAAIVRETASPLGRPATDGGREEAPKQPTQDGASGTGIGQAALRRDTNATGNSLPTATALKPPTNAVLDAVGTNVSTPLAATTALGSVHTASASLTEANTSVANTSVANSGSGSIEPTAAAGLHLATATAVMPGGTNGAAGTAAPAFQGISHGSNGSNGSVAGGVAGPARTDLPAISEPHRTLVATPTALEVGVPDGTQGWIKIRAEVGEQGQVNASLAAGSSASQEMLHRELPALNAYLHSEQMTVTATVSERSFAAVNGQGGASDDAGRASANAGLTHGGATGGGPQSENRQPGDGNSSQQGIAGRFDTSGSIRSYDGGGVNEIALANTANPGFEGESGQWLNVRA